MADGQTMDGNAIPQPTPRLPFPLTRLFYASLSIGPLYLAYGMFQFLPGRRFSSAIKGLFASLLAQAVTQGLVFLIGYFYL